MRKFQVQDMAFLAWKPLKRCLMNSILSLIQLIDQDPGKRGCQAGRQATGRDLGHSEARQSLASMHLPQRGLP